MPNDIFVSYAGVDNEPLPGADKGWVTTLINGLKNLLGQKLGCRDAYTLWMDDELRGYQQRTPETIEQLENSALLLLVLSPGYLASQWCRLELSAFLTQVGENSGRVFVVECDEVEERPNELSDLRGYQFWEKDDKGKPRTLAIPKPRAEEPEYYQKLDDLARELSDKIKSLREQPETEQAVPPPVPVDVIPPTTIFLAQVSDDLAQHRDEVKRYLEQQNVRVLPEQVYLMADTEIQQRIDQDLSQCRCFVQLLSQKLDQGLPNFQYKRAQAAKLPILQWRDNRLKLNEVRDSKHKALLSQSTVMASNLENFKKRIINQLKEEVKTELTQGNDFVFINAASEDMGLALEIQDFFMEKEIESEVPLISNDITPTQKKTDLEEQLLACKAVIVLYNTDTPVVWVKQQIRYCQRIQTRRGENNPYKKLAVYNKPFPDKQPLILPNNINMLVCPTPQEETCLPEFMRILRDE
jgi:hypothetical protein